MTSYFVKWNDAEGRLSAMRYRMMWLLLALAVMSTYAIGLTCYLIGQS